jgi:hypothetical protein
MRYVAWGLLMANCDAIPSERVPSSIVACSAGPRTRIVVPSRMRLVICTSAPTARARSSMLINPSPLAEFEAQLRAVSHVEEQIQRVNAGVNDERWRRLKDVLHKQLSGMLTNNANIRSVLNELAKDVRRPAERSEMELS